MGYSSAWKCDNSAKSYCGQTLTECIMIDGQIVSRRRSGTVGSKMPDHDHDPVNLQSRLPTYTVPNRQATFLHVPLLRYPRLPILERFTTSHSCANGVCDRACCQRAWLSTGPDSAAGAALKHHDALVLVPGHELEDITCPTPLRRSSLCAHPLPDRTVFAFLRSVCASWLFLFYSRRCGRSSPRSCQPFRGH